MKIQKELCFKELNDFLDYFENTKKSSEQTLYNYFRDLILFFRYMKFIKGKASPVKEIAGISIDDIDIDFIKTINTEDIYKYLDYLEIKKNNSSTTIARRTASLKMFFRYLIVTAEVITKDPTIKLASKTIKKEPLKFMNETECIALLNSINGLNKERDYCILVIFINCGMRLSELVRLNDTDIKPDGTVTIRGTNGRTIYFNKACMEALEEYNNFKEEYFKGKRYDHHAVFVGQGGKRLTGRWIEEIVKRRIKKAGFGDKGLSPCKLRHTSAVLMYRHGVEIGIMKDILGHKTIVSTEIYVENKPSQIETVMKNNSISRNKK